MASVKRTGGLTSDINLSRGRDDNLLSHGSAAERAYADRDEKIVEQAQTIKHLQNHSKPPRRLTVPSASLPPGEAN